MSTARNKFVADELHPLDRPIWNALSRRQARFAQQAHGIRRFDPVYAPFAATAEGSLESYAQLATLVPQGGHVVLQQSEAVETPPQLTLLRVSETVQMISTKVQSQPMRLDFQVLTSADARDMQELTQLTKPGPFAERACELGRFVGLRIGGTLVAMAGERLRLEGFTEVSAVCTHPDYRGRGFAIGLMQEIERGIRSRGETPFLHAFADNHGAIALYERLGYVIRWRPVLTVFQRQGAS